MRAALPWIILALVCLSLARGWALWRQHATRGSQQALDTALMRLVSAGPSDEGKMRRLRELLAAGANPQARRQAFRSGSGPRVWRGRDEGATPFMLALSFSDAPMIRELSKDADFGAINFLGQPAYCLLASIRDEGLACELLESVSDELLRQPVPPEAGPGPVEMAARFGRARTLRALLARAPALALPPNPDALSEAAASDHEACARELLSTPGPWQSLSSQESAIARVEEGLDNMGLCLPFLLSRAAAQREREALDQDLAGSSGSAAAGARRL